MTKPRFVGGRHYTEHVEEVKALKRAGRLNEAEELLLKLVATVEEEARAQGWGVAPWYYEQPAIIYRRRKDYAAEVAILKRYMAQPHAPGVGPQKLSERLKKVQHLLERAGLPAMHSDGA